MIEERRHLPVFKINDGGPEGGPSIESDPRLKRILLGDYIATDEEKFLKSAFRGDEGRLQQYVSQGVNLNCVDPRTGATALHYVAAHGARPAFRVLMTTGRCNFLMRDKKGRLASELAGIYGHDPAMARLLLRKELQQAHAQGIKLRRREPT